MRRPWSKAPIDRLGISISEPFDHHEQHRPFLPGLATCGDMLECRQRPAKRLTG
jgi:hypothetical protein